MASPDQSQVTVSSGNFGFCLCLKDIWASLGTRKHRVLTGTRLELGEVAQCNLAFLSPPFILQGAKLLVQKMEVTHKKGCPQATRLEEWDLPGDDGERVQHTSQSRGCGKGLRVLVVPGIAL